jgi:hypothetical protein
VRLEWRTQQFGTYKPAFVDRLTVGFGEGRFWVEQVDVAGAAIHAQKYHTTRTRWVMRHAGR